MVILIMIITITTTTIITIKMNNGINKMYLVLALLSAVSETCCNMLCLFLCDK